MDDISTFGAGFELGRRLGNHKDRQVLTAFGIGKDGLKIVCTYLDTPMSEIVALLPSIDDPFHLVVFNDHAPNGMNILKVTKP